LGASTMLISLEVVLFVSLLVSLEAYISTISSVLPLDKEEGFREIVC